MAASYKQLVSEHDRIEELVDSILRMATDDQSESRRISTALSELAQVVAEHLEHEDALLYATAGERLGEQLEALKQDWLDYLSEWTHDCIAVDGETFSLETANILTRLKARVRLESELLYASALQKGQISLR
jgi:hemerythrin-like domain-containing protein